MVFSLLLLLMLLLLIFCFQMIIVENIPGFGYKNLSDNKPLNKELSVTYQKESQTYVMKNSLITATFDNTGRMIRLVDNEIK